MEEFQSRIIHTQLNHHVSLDEIDAFSSAGISAGFPMIRVLPLYVPRIRAILKDCPVKVSTVIGYPYGHTAIEAKVAELVLAILDGIDEACVVVNPVALMNNDWQFLANELNTILQMVRSRQKMVNCLIDTTSLTTDDILKCCDLYGIAGVDAFTISYQQKDGEHILPMIKTMRDALADPIPLHVIGDIKNFTFATKMWEAGIEKISCNGADLLNSCILQN